MQKDSHVDYVMYNGSGKRLRRFEDLPPTLKSKIQTHFPIYTEPPPVDDDRPNETSWSDFKKRVEAKRAAEAEKE